MLNGKAYCSFSWQAPIHVPDGEESPKVKADEEPSNIEFRKSLELIVATAVKDKKDTMHQYMGDRNDIVDSELARGSSMNVCEVVPEHEFPYEQEYDEFNAQQKRRGR